MAVPPQRDFYRPVLEIAAESDARISRQQLIVAAASRLNVSDEDRLEVFGGSGTALKFDYRVTSAALKLSAAGLLDRPQRGHFLITQAGKGFLTDHSGPIARGELVALQRNLEPNNPRPSPLPTTDDDDELSEIAPTELMAAAFDESLNELMSELQASINGVSPDRFERLVVELLERMGYGEGRAVGRSGDGGIDGIINQDALGLEKVYVQAKRYTSGSVGEPEIRNFAGSMIAHGATKGVFITASQFSATAKQTAANVSQRNETIRLVEGRELALLMIRHGVGVVTERTYEIKKLDENYFAEEI